MKRRFSLALLIAVLVAGALASAGALLSDEADEEAFLATTATPDPTATTPQLLTAPVPSATPMPDPTRNVPEVTLIDTQYGGLIPLWERGYRVHEVFFNNETLYYVRFPIATGVEDAEIMALELQSHTTHKLADGYNMAVSVNGDIAYTRRAADGTETGAILDRFRRPAPNPGGATRFEWSPDGKWLASSDAYSGDGVPMKQYIMDFDFRTGRVREFAETLPCNCDGNPGAIWAPDSTRFEYTRLVRTGDGIERASDIYEPFGLVHFPAREFHMWISSSRYVERGDWDAGEYSIVDIASGLRTAIGRVSVLSPDRVLVATIADSVRQTFDVQETDGSTILVGLGGLPFEFSQDGRYVLAGSTYGPCIGLNVYHVADGEGQYCRASAGGSFSPNSRKLAVVAVDPPNPVTPQTAEVWIVELDTGAERKMASDLRGGLGCAKWSADSRYVAITFCPGV